MDTTKAITHIGLCAGYGGIELGLGRAIPNLRSVALCEIEAFAIANLVAKMEAGLMDAAPVWTDLKTFPWAAFRDRVDILTGGYPCQPFSSAGKRLGKEDPRHLWPYIADGIRILRPGLCFFENVEGHISLGLRDVIEELENIGYKTAWGIFSAAEVGAPHQRKRVFILAHTADQRYEGGSLIRSSGPQGAIEGCGTRAWPSRPGEPQHEWEPPRVVGNAGNKESRWVSEICGREEVAGAGQSSERREAQRKMDRGFDGTPNRMDYAELFTTCDNRTDELRLLGNGVVPATAERAFRVLMEELIC